MPPSFPIWVLPIKELLELDKLETHEELRGRGVLHEWKPGDGEILFVSHTWLRYKAPDGLKDEKLTLLKQLVNKIFTGKLDVLPNWSIEIQTKMKYKLEGKAIKAALQTGYIWLDLASIPQASKANQILAIQSIPHYIAACSYFVVLAGSGWQHESGQYRGINEWSMRGWCRVEQLSNFLSPTPQPVVVCQSLTNIETYPPRGYMGCTSGRYPVGEANFTVDDDRIQLGPVILQLIADRKALALERGELPFYRTLHCLTERLVAGTGVAFTPEKTLDEWLTNMQLATPTAFDGICSPLHYAIIAGRVDFASELIDRGCDVNGVTGDLQHMIDFVAKKTSAICLASVVREQPEMIRMLLERGADPYLVGNGGDNLGNAFVMASIGFFDSPTGEHNLDVLYKHDPRLIESTQPLFGKYSKENPGGGTCSALGLGMCAPGTRLLEHVLANYPERAKVELSRVDNMGATWLGHQLVYPAGPDFISRILQAGRELGVDVTYGAMPPLPTPRTILKIMRTVFRLTKASNFQAHMANFTCCPRPLHLHVCAAYAHTQSLELLLNEAPQLDINGKNMLGRTPLHCAARQGHESVVDVLLAAGADPNVKEERGRKPSAIAKKRGHTVLALKLKHAEETAKTAGGARYRASTVAPAAATAPSERVTSVERDAPSPAPSPPPPRPPGIYTQESMGSREDSV